MEHHSPMPQTAMIKSLPQRRMMKATQAEDPAAALPGTRSPNCWCGRRRHGLLKQSSSGHFRVPYDCTPGRNGPRGS
jgi:hypothetical protein